MELILASRSPRRAALLRQAGIPHRVILSDLPEGEQQQFLDPIEMAVSLALQKARGVAATLQEGLVLGADTLICHGGEILGKPADRGEARRMLRCLSGGRHRVITGLALVDVQANKQESCFCETRVWMRILEDELIDAYVATGEPMDKAGAYAIQGKAAIFIEKLEGCYFNVVGLPLHQLSLLLSRMGIKPWSGWR
ncbi:MAG: septum formation protein Maf [Firmicutes bacterium]|nr:septum formation protein Maf [Bacillota bacterium]